MSPPVSGETLWQNHDSAPDPWEYPLSAADRPLLQSLGCVWPEDADEAVWLQEMNSLIAIGSMNLINIQEDDPRRVECTAARQKFYASILKTEDVERVHEYCAMLPAPTLFLGGQRALRQYGISPLEAIRKLPLLCTASGRNITDKVCNLQSLGIDAAAAANITPSVLTLGIGSVSEHLQPLYTAARLMGNADYKDFVHKAISYAPIFLTAKPQKLRTLTRIVAALVERDSSVPTIPETVSLVIESLNRTTAAYLEHGTVIRTARGLQSWAKDYTDYTTQELQAIIAQYPDDPVVREYLKGYPIDDAAATDYVWQRHKRARDRWQRQREDLPLDWQGPLTLGDATLPADRALRAVANYPELTEEEYNGLESELINAVICSDRTRELTLRRALAARCVPLVITIADSCSGDAEEKIAKGHLAVARVAAEYASPAGIWKRAGLRDSIIMAIMTVLEGYKPRFEDRTLQDYENEIHQALRSLDPDVTEESQVLADQAASLITPVSAQSSNQALPRRRAKRR